MPSSNNQSEKKLTLVILLILSLTIIFIVFYFWNVKEVKPTNFFARDINDASYDCEDKIDQQFGTNLINKTYDEFSSRYDPSRRQYIVYYQLTVSENIKETPVISDLMAKCVVWERVGYVSDFSVFKR